MKLRAIPDPATPSGGYGYLVADETDIAEASVSVQVCDAYSGRWLGAPIDEGLVSVGDGTWQSEPHAFGPYPAQVQGSEIWVRIGPEIVNKIEEYTPLRIIIADHTADLIWPDDVLPRIAQALVGEIRSTVASSPEIERPRTIMAEDAGEELLPIENVVDDPIDEDEPSRRGLFSWMLLVAVLAGAVAAFLLWPEEEIEQNSGIAYEPDRNTPPATPCTHASIAAKGGGFTAMDAAVRDCGAKISANEAIRLLEMGVREGSPDALLLFGKIYDVQQIDDLIETTVGLTFEDDPSTAAEYYNRAKAAGSPEAESLLIVVCERLSKLSSTLARGAFDDFCPKS